MSEKNPKSGQHPYGGTENTPEDSGLPGEVPEEGTQQAPESAGRTDDDTASRAATEGQMSSPERGLTEPSEGIPEQVHAPGPEDASESNAPGGSAKNQSGRTPDEYGDPTHSIS